MPKSRIINIRVTRAQYERIILHAEAKGHRTISDYIRNSLLGNDYVTDERIQKIYEVIVTGKECVKPQLERPLQAFIEG